VAALLAAAFGSSLSVQAKVAAHPDLSTEKRAAELLEASTIPVTDLPGVCSQLARDWHTLGRLVAFHRAHANVKNHIRCKRAGHRWMCEAEFIYNNEKEEDDGWYLNLKYSVDDDSKIGDLECEAGP
jgi:hypothetical protein